MLSFVLTDRNYVPVGEVLNVKDPRVAVPLSKLTTASLSVRLDNPLADYMMSTACYLKAYRDESLVHFGAVVSAEETATKENVSVSINSVGGGWDLTKRLSGKSATGVIFADTDRAQAAKQLIDYANAAGETGVSTAGGVISAASAVNYTAGPYKNTYECITNDLARAVDGFDWVMDPIDNFSNGAVTSQKIASFRAAPVIGANRPDAVYEWGGGRHNLESYTRRVDRSTQANTVYHIAPAGPDAPGFPVISAIDSASISDWKLLEDLASADLVDAGMRQQIANAHIAVRRMPRQTLEAVPHIDPGNTGRLPQYGTDFTVGDVVPVRATYKGVVRFDVFMRVYGIEFTQDANNVERQALTFVEESV